MQAPSSLAFAPIVKATAVTVVIGLCLLIFPLAPIILTPFLVLPLAHLVASRGVTSGVVVAVITGGLVYLVGGASSALLVFLLILCMGIGIGQAVRRGWRFGRSLAATAGAALLAFVALGNHDMAGSGPQPESPAGKRLCLD